MPDLRCDNGILFGNIIEEGVVEVKCKSNRCGHRPGVVILHRFSTSTGELLNTLKYQEPKRTAAPDRLAQATG